MEWQPQLHSILQYDSLMANKMPEYGRWCHLTWFKHTAEYVAFYCHSMGRLEDSLHYRVYKKPGWELIFFQDHEHITLTNRNSHWYHWGLKSVFFLLCHTLSTLWFQTKNPHVLSHPILTFCFYASGTRLSAAASDPPQSFHSPYIPWITSHDRVLPAFSERPLHLPWNILLHNFFLLADLH